MKDNPFLVQGYVSKAYFCGREKELALLKSNIESGRNTTLISPRRMGKTGLIHRTFDEMNAVASVYVDIMATQALEDFIKTLSNAILQKFPEKTTIGEKFFRFIKTLRPLISFDNITGDPQVEITYRMESEKTQTLQNILRFLDSQEQTIVVAIDEFQQITEYPEKNVEALLRSEIQFLKHVTFIFCGSKRSLMIDMFSNAKRPFYQSTAFLILDKIPREEYEPFISKLFNERALDISQDSLNFILDWTSCYTFYTQSLCNKIFSFKENVSVELVKKACKEILEEQSASYFQLRQLLSHQQWNYLISVAKEGEVEKPTAQDFLMKYRIGTPSNSKRLLNSLCENDLILETFSVEKKTYQIYDVFLGHWFRENY